MDLILVSGTRNNIDSHADLHIQLDRYHQLPQPFSARPWKNSRVTSLRDRLMIEWVFCHREAMKTLHDIITSIGSKLTSKHLPTARSSSTRSLTLIVGISCSTGTCLSPCFVERLYDHYTTFPPYDTMKVTRSHLNALSESNSYQWQQLPSGSKFCRRRNELENKQHLKQFISSRDWSPLPAPLNIRLEETYLKNPLNTNVIIGDVQIDFVDGSLFNKSTGQKSFLRCITQPTQASFTIRELTNDDYKLCCKKYEAAGILPYSVHPVTGEAIFLVGQLTYDGGCWCDFGGLKSRHRFRETAAQTAARECYEETLGVLGTSSHLLNALRNYIENNAFKVVNENTNYIGHLLRVAFNHYPAQFATIAIEASSDDKELEVNAMRWLPLSAIRRANQSTMAGDRIIETYAIDEVDGSYTSSIRLRIEFAWSLCIAEKLGVLDSIAYIAEQKWQPSDRRSLPQLRKEHLRRPPVQQLVKPLNVMSLREAVVSSSSEEESSDDNIDIEDHLITHYKMPSTDIPDRKNSPLLVTDPEPTGSKNIATGGGSGTHLYLKSVKGKVSAKDVVKLYGMGAGQFFKRPNITSDV